ncbi:uncharacterized protein LOC116264522 [Nymphaea colorata]|nr:uncharacterized protein LOC116264522 [Nymphaea colorata]
MPRDLPGLYYDPVKNRYFPVKARGAPSTAAPAHSNQPELSCEREIYNRNYIKTLKLLEGRELHGRFSVTQSKKFSFQQQYQISQASAPTVWKYRRTDGIVDSSMEHFTSFVQTSEGQKRTGILAMGNMAGSISIYEVGKFGHLGSATARTPVCLRPHRALQDGGRPEYIRACEGYVIPLFSSVSCITRRKKMLSSANDQFSSNHSCALVSSLGSGGSGGSVYVLDFAKPLDLHQDVSSLHSRLVKVASTNCTIWSADSNCDGTKAIIGTNRGAALLHLERQELSWICRTKSDILSLQFDHSGNVALCGLRNGAIIVMDIRQRHLNSLDNFSRAWSSMDQKSNHGLQVSKNLRTWLKGDVRPLGAAFMPSAVCSLASLYSYGHYFLASSMDGSLGLFDSRLLQRGAVHHYEGHVNSHSRLHIGVDPTETFFLAGGEDCCMRIWNIKTGEILYGSRISSSPVVAMCWPQNESVLSASDELPVSNGVEFEMESSELTHSWAAWLGSLEGLFYIHGS